MRKQQKIQKIKKSRGLGAWLPAWLPLSASAILAVTMVAQGSLDGRPRANDPTQQPCQTAASTQPASSGDDSRISASVWQDEVREGMWSVDDSIWTFENCIVASARLATVMQQPPTDDQPIESSAAEHLTLLDLIPVERATVEHIDALTIRSIDYGTVRASLCYRQSNDQHFILAAKVANQIDAQRWQVITLKPRTVEASHLEHLLPLGEVSANACQRVGRTGQLQCEIVETSSSIGELVRTWQSAGWSVQDAGSTEPTDMNLSCCKGKQLIQVRATERGSEAKLTLVLTAVHNL